MIKALLNPKYTFPNLIFYYGSITIFSHYLLIGQSSTDSHPFANPRSSANQNITNEGKSIHQSISSLMTFGRFLDP